MKISIITVTYNCKDDIIPTLESLISQRESDIEYWIIDGNSTDGTAETARGYQDKMKKAGIDYHVISEPDDGIYDAMNKGIRKAAGDVIGILNSGDWYEKDTIKTVKKVFRKYNCSLMFGNIRIHRQNGSTFIKKARIRRFQSSRDWNHPTMFVKAGLYKQYPFLNKGIHDDYGFYLQMVKKNEKIIALDKVLADFVMGGVSNKKGFRAAKKRILDRYRYCYRINGYSRWYLLECIFIEATKYLLG